MSDILLADDGSPERGRADVLMFPHQGLDAGSSPSILKVYVPTITASHKMLEGRSVRKHPLILCFVAESFLA